MFRVLTCLREQHDPLLVLLAVLVCACSSAAAVFLVRQAREQRRSRGWLVSAGCATGFGIWSTHFIAVLAFDPKVPVGFEPAITFLSLALAIGLTCAGLMLALAYRGSWVEWLGGAIVSGGIAAMHYTGMVAIEMPAVMLWAPDLVLLSILLGALFTVPAVLVAVRGRGRTSACQAALLLVLGIAAHHFTAMGAVTLVPTRGTEIDELALSPGSVAFSITVAAGLVLLMCVGAAVLWARAEKARRASEREFRILVRGITDCALYRLDLDGRVTSWNAGATRLKGYSEDEAIGLPLGAFYSAEDRAAGRPEAALATALETGKFSAEGWRYRKDGSRFWAQVTMEPLLDESGRPYGFAKISRDVTQAKADADQLAETTANLDIALTNMHQGLSLFDAQERLVLSNARVGELFGIAVGACPVGTHYLETMRIALAGLTGGAIDEAAVEAAYHRHRACIERGGGTLVAELTKGCTIAIVHRPLADGGWVTTYEDITERRRAETQIAHMALHDSLTGLPNRVHFNQRLDVELERAAGDGRQVAVIGIDLDRFKEINDTHGHAVGDAVLTALAARMTAMLEDGEFVARFGGDEFAALKPLRDPRELQEFVRRLEGALLQPIETAIGIVSGGASIGIAIAPNDGRQRERLLNNADLAMYRAKTSVGQHICFYEPRMDEQARQRRAIATDLRDGIAAGHFHMAYQIQRSLQTGETVGYEALLRWRHPLRGSVSPAEFIPIAEESGLILDIGEWVLRQACRDAAGWREPHKVAVNLSPLQFGHPDLPGLVREILVETGLSPRRLELEITETTLIGDKARALHILRQIKSMGVTIAIDDFGTGYSSLDTLNSFPFDKIKIDRSFLAEAHASAQARAIIRAVLALGRSMGVPVLAEGIETEAQLSLLRADGCEEGQGYLFGYPEAAGTSERPGRAAA